MKKEVKVQVKQKKRGGTGAFISGMLFMLMLMVFTFVGAGFYIVNYITLEKIESWYDLDIDLGSDPSGLKTKNILELIALGQDIADNLDSVTLNYLEENFGIVISDYIYDIDISSLKDIALVNITDGIGNIVNCVTLSNLVDILGLELPDMPIINNNMDQPLLDAVNSIMASLDTDNLTFGALVNDFGFDFDQSIINLIGEDTIITEIDGIFDTLTIGDLADFGIDLDTILAMPSVSSTTLISDIGNVLTNLKVGDLTALNIDTDIFTSLSGITEDTLISNITDAFDSLTVGDLKAFNIDVTAFTQLSSVNDETLIADLGSVFEGLTVGDVKTLVPDMSIFDNFDDSVLLSEFDSAITIGDIIGIDDSATGIMAELKDITLSNFDEDTINNISLGSILNVEGDATGIIALLSEYNIGDLDSSLIDSFTLGDILGVSNSDSGILAALADIQLGNFDESSFDNISLSTIIGDDNTGIMAEIAKLTISELTEDNINKIPLSSIFGTDNTGILAVLETLTIGELNASTINGITFGQVLGIGDGDEVSALISALKDVSLGEFDTDTITNIVNDMTMGELMEITDTSSILYQLKDNKISELGTAIDNLTISQLFDSTDGVLSLIDADTTISELPQALADTFDMDTLTLGDLYSLDPTMTQLTLDGVDDETTINELFDIINELQQQLESMQA